MKVKTLFISIFISVIALLLTYCKSINSKTEDVEVVESVHNNSSDTISLDAYLLEMEDFVSLMNEIHIASAADTIQLENLEKKMTESNLAYNELNTDFDQLNHSEKVRTLQDMVLFMGGILRIHDELKAVGVESEKWDLGSDEESFREVLRMFEEELELELN